MYKGPLPCPHGTSSMQKMKSQVTYNRKLSGSVFLILRISLDILILISILSRTYAVEVSLKVFLESVYLTILSPFIS